MYLPETIIPPDQGSWFGLAILTNYQFVTTQYYKINLFKSASVQSLILVRVPTYDVWWSLFSVSGSSRYLSCVVVSILCIWSRRQAGSLTRYEAVLLDTRTSCTKQVSWSNRPRIYGFKPSNPINIKHWYTHFFYFFLKQTIQYKSH